MASLDRGEVWLVNLGMAAKMRPCLVLSVKPGPNDRQIVTVVPHTTSLHGTDYEVAIPKSFLKPGAFDAQGLGHASKPKFLRKLGELQPDELALVEDAVRRWLDL